MLGFVLTIPKSPASASVSIGLFAYMTFVTALGISFKDFIRVLRNPGIVVAGHFILDSIRPSVKFKWIKKITLLVTRPAGFCSYWR